MIKFFLVGVEHYDDIANKLSLLNDNLNICKKFSTNNSDESLNNSYMYLDTKEVFMAYKNNAILYMNNDSNFIDGVLIDDLYNSDILTLTISEFNAISNKIFNELDILIIFIDNAGNAMNKEISLSDYNYFSERCEEKNMLYFLNESNEIIINTVLSYYLGSEDTRKELLEKFN